MIALEPLSPDPRALLARAHPLPKIAAALVLMLALFLTVDLVTAGIVLLGLVAAIPLTGLPPRPLLKRVAPIALAALGIAFFNWVLAPVPDPRAGAAAALRLVAIALSGVLVVATIDPTDLADALVEHLHAPPRFVLGALAAWRLAPIFGQQWWILGLARRARGGGTERDPLGRLRGFAGRTFGLLVGAIRRGTELALAMDARGFGRRPCRTLARPRPIRAANWLVLMAALTLAVGATAVSISTGEWRPLFGR